MLRSFRVANHRSIRAQQELVLLPVYDRSRPANRVAAIYGANASGKSNILHALIWMQYAVLSSFASWTPDGGVPRAPFKLDESGHTDRSSFEIDLVVDGVRHFYGFAVDNEAVREEWLHTYPKRKRRIIFERTGQDWTFGSTVRGPVEAASALTRPNALFLSVAARSNVAECEPLFRWFSDGLSHAEPGSEVGAVVRKAFAPDSPWRQTVLDLLRAADLGISDVRLADPFEPAVSLEAFVKSGPGQLRFYHGEHRSPLTVDEESAGTRTWLNLTLAIATALAGPKVLLVDEADTTLHPHLARHLVNLFRDPEVNRRGAQLIFTCHDATILDEDTLGRDEIWFVEKDHPAGTTRLYPMTDFRPRKRENTQRRYLAGSYGAVPVLSEFALRRAVESMTDPDAA